MFFAFAAALVVIGLTACGKSEDKPASPSAPASTTPSGKAPKSPAGVPGTTPASMAIGRIDALDGDVRIVGATGERRAQTGTQIEEGDTVKIGADAWALLGMSDGASVTVRPDSELRFDRYRYAPDGEASLNSAVMSLARGAFRSITGYIGRTNRSGYQIRTPTATIGIRGTDHEPAYYPPPVPGGKSDRAPGTYDKVNEGETVIRRPTGEVSVKRGQTAFAHNDIKIRPRLLPTPPAFYQQHAQVDRKVAVRRTEFHRQFEQQQQRLQQERKQQQQRTLKKEQEQRKDSKQLEQRKDKKQLEERKDKKQLEERKDKKQLEERKDKKQQDQKGKQQKQAEQKDRKQAEQRDRKQADQKGKKPQDQKKQPEQKAKDEKKMTLPPSVAERIKNMQRGDKSTSPTPQQSLPQQQRQQPQQQQRQQPQQQQRQQPQQQNQDQQAQQLRDKAKKKPEPPR
jgi:DNA segregation ATPase FtsK/SpoIIIE-like protein